MSSSHPCRSWTINQLSSPSSCLSTSCPGPASLHTRALSACHGCSLVLQAQGRSQSGLGTSCLGGFAWRVCVMSAALAGQQCRTPQVLNAALLCPSSPALHCKGQLRNLPCRTFPQCQGGNNIFNSLEN